VKYFIFIKREQFKAVATCDAVLKDNSVVQIKLRKTENLTESKYANF